MLELASLILQIIGIVTILVSQVVFLLRVRKKWGSLKKAFLDLTMFRWGYNDKEILEMSQTELQEAFKKFPLADFLYDDFVFSVIGLFCTLIGILLPLFESLFLFFN